VNLPIESRLTLCSTNSSYVRPFVIGICDSGLMATSKAHNDFVIVGASGVCYSSHVALSSCFLIVEFCFSVSAFAVGWVRWSAHGRLKWPDQAAIHPTGTLVKSAALLTSVPVGCWSLIWLFVGGVVSDCSV
jgi:hypothetical protein